MPWSSRLRSQAKSPFLIWKAQDDLTGTLIMRRDSSHNPDLPSTTIVHEMNDDVQPLEPRISGEFLVSIICLRAWWKLSRPHRLLGATEAETARRSH